MSAEAAALARAIRDCPDDDLPRLALADLLEETGDPDRAGFVRAQVELARIPADDPRRPHLEDREHELLAANEDHWLGDLVREEGLREWEWDRGFLSEVAATPWFMLGAGRDLFVEHPVRRWRVMSSDQDMAQDLRETGHAPWADRLEALDLAGWYQEVGELERFLTHSEFGRLRELDLTGRPGLDFLPDILGRSPLRESLTALRCGGRYAGECGRLDAWDLVRALEPARMAELDVPGAMLTAGDVRTLLVAPCFRSLTALNVRDNGIGPDGWDAFRPARCSLAELDLSGTPLGAFALEDLLRCEAATELRSLHLNRCGSAMANVRALVQSRFWRQAEELRVSGGTVPTHALDPLFASREGPPGLRALDLSENFVRDAGVAAICAADWSANLEFLDLSRNYLTDDAARTIAVSGRFTRLRTLHLSYNHAEEQDDAEPHESITDIGARALADSPTLARLRRLVLTGTNLTAAGVEAALNGPHWRLDGLGLAGCDLTPDAVRVLAGSPRLARLGWLDLAGNYRLSGAALAPLAESEHLCRLTELNVRGIDIDDDVRAALRERLGRRLGE